MKSLDELIGERRSVREYSDQPVEKEKIEQLLNAARLAPSACNAQPWRFVVVSEPTARAAAIKEGLGGVVVPNTWAKTAPVIIVACSDLSLVTHKLAERVQGVQYHLIDIGIAMEHLVLKATELGLGTCYIGWFNGKALCRTLQLPSSWKAECLITLGYPASVPEPTPRKSLQDISVVR
ncbi:MAG: hypothetical protein A2293_00570 [Elusimicrobia bacterium RIFOXYB2_FULL_49_7]|nr:MAG: hypothetical protein A2293_00570 [Elusimicrobia bacterium RIFOXYB2_FULL_49_7]